MIVQHQTPSEQYAADKARVAAGAALLDERDPLWWEASKTLVPSPEGLVDPSGDRRPIFLDELDMVSSLLCVLGQRYGSYWKGMQFLRLEMVYAGHGYGFTTTGLNMDFDSARQGATRPLWVAEIQRRRDAAAAVGATS